MCNFNGKESFLLTHRAITQRSVISLSPIFTKMVLNRAQGLKEKVKKFQCEKMSTGGDITKNVGGGPPSSFRVKLECFLPTFSTEEQNIDVNCSYIDMDK